MSVSVCVCVRACVRVVRVCACLSAIISSELRPIFTKIFMHVTYGRGLVFVWWRSDILCTSGFMDDVIFAHKPSEVARHRRAAKAQCTRSLGYKMCAAGPH